MGSFDVVVIATDRYPTPPGPLPSSASAERLVALMTEGRGGVVREKVVATTRAEVLDALDRWTDGAAPKSTIVYLVGHGTDDGVHHSFVAPAQQGTATAEIASSSLASVFFKDWTRRQGDESSWVLFVLDCCGADVGVTNLYNALTAVHVKQPRRLGLWPTMSRGASRNGQFVAALDRVLRTFNENDAVIPLSEVFRRMRPDLGDIEPKGYLADAALDNPLHSATPVVMNLDVYAELRQVVHGLAPEVRSHFLSKAQGAEAGEVDWYFSGRRAQIAGLCEWLHGPPAGLRVVTGEAGSGKSALLGHLAVLAEDGLVDAYRVSGLAPGLAAGPRPPSGVFDAVFHLAGRTLEETLDDVSRRAGLAEGARTPDAFVEMLKVSRRKVTLLADALDEAQEPERIADFLRLAVRSNVARAIVGTRRSLTEGPDRPHDPARHELLDALDVQPDELLVVGHDGMAIQDYVAARLGAVRSPYSGHPLLVARIASRIAALHHPFLFARLVTSELLARPLLCADSPDLTMLLSRGHRGVFAAAVDRIGAKDRVTVAMLRALALSRGRGLPESAGTWVNVARAVAHGVDVPDDAARRTIDEAAPYVTLDAEAGQCVYRLAHQTFVEHFRSLGEAGREHRDVARGLRREVEAQGGWASANHYPVRYLAEHVAAGASLDHPLVVDEEIASLVTDGGWLSRAVALLGVDRVVDTIAGAQRAVASPVANIVERVLRRSRIALNRDAGQLAAQIHARLKDDPRPRLADLGSSVAAHSTGQWLCMRRGALDWQADLETTYGFVGKARALAFGSVGDRTLLAIGVEDEIYLWDPVRGATDGTTTIRNDGLRVTALALSTMNGRPVVIVVSSFDGTGKIRDARTGNVVGRAFSVRKYVNSVALGLLDDRPVVFAGEDSGGITAWDARTGEEISAVAEHHNSNRCLGLTEWNGRVLAHVRRVLRHSVGDEVTVEIASVDVDSGDVLFERPIPLAVDRIVGGVSGGRLALAAQLHAGYLTTWLPDGGEVVGNVPLALGGMSLRSFAVGEVQGRLVAALAPDYDSTALVELREIVPRAFSPTRPWRGRPIRAMCVQAGKITALTDDPIQVHDVESDGEARPLDSQPDAATVSRFLTGGDGTGARFIASRDAGGHILVRPPVLTLNSKLKKLRVDEPLLWPRTAVAVGLVGDRPVVAWGSVEGAVWLWDPESGDIVGGPYVDLPSGHASARRQRSRRENRSVSSVALGTHPRHGPVLAIATNGHVRLLAVPSGEPVTTLAQDATVVEAVALGTLPDEFVLVTGSQGGVLAVWGLESNLRIAALTFDHPIECVWIVHGANSIAALAVSQLYVLNLEPGGDRA